MFGRLHMGFGALPGLMRIGLLIVLIGGVLDLLYHALPLPWAMMVDLYPGHNGWPLHVVVLVGMATTLVGVVVMKGFLVVWAMPIIATNLTPTAVSPA